MMPPPRRRIVSKIARSELEFLLHNIYIYIYIPYIYIYIYRFTVVEFWPTSPDVFFQRFLKANASRMITAPPNRGHVRKSTCCYGLIVFREAWVALSGKMPRGCLIVFGSLCPPSRLMRTASWVELVSVRLAEARSHDGRRHRQSVLCKFLRILAKPS